jgi:hypothetical protein
MTYRLERVPMDDDVAYFLFLASVFGAAAIIGLVVYALSELI